MNKGMLRDQIRQIATKVPEATVLFWITKVLTTGMGETTSDYFVHVWNPITAIALAGIVLLISLAAQFSVRRYIPWIYWLAVVMVSIFGTMAADVLHVGFGIPYIVSTVFFLIVLIAVFVFWYSCERTLSIHSIYTFRREFFYWATVLTTFALGTAVGDMTATTLHLGYFASGVLFAVLIAVPGIAYWNGWLGEVTAFWFAYILTRPLGASFADWMGVVHSRGGLGWGTGSVSVVLLFLIICLVAYLAWSGEDRGRAVSIRR
jgi:uncharacterized membrane-anchored protein